MIYFFHIKVYWKYPTYVPVLRALILISLPSVYIIVYTYATELDRKLSNKNPCLYKVNTDVRLCGGGGQESSNIIELLLLSSL